MAIATLRDVTVALSVPSLVGLAPVAEEKAFALTKGDETNAQGEAGRSASVNLGRGAVTAAAGTENLLGRRDLCVASFIVT
jgi:hypothetical protein